LIRDLEDEKCSLLDEFNTLLAEIELMCEERFESAKPRIIIVRDWAA